MTTTKDVQDLDPHATIGGRTIAQWLEIAEMHKPLVPVSIEMLAELVDHYAWLDGLVQQNGATTAMGLQILEDIQAELEYYGT
jgi:hypothetical protein